MQLQPQVLACQPRAASPCADVREQFSQLEGRWKEASGTSLSRKCGVPDSGRFEGRPARAACRHHARSAVMSGGSRMRNARNGLTPIHMIECVASDPAPATAAPRVSPPTEVVSIALRSALPMQTVKGGSPRGRCLLKLGDAHACSIMNRPEMPTRQARAPGCSARSRNCKRRRGTALRCYRSSLRLPVWRSRALHAAVRSLSSKVGGRSPWKPVVI